MFYHEFAVSDAFYLGGAELAGFFEGGDDGGVFHGLGVCIGSGIGEIGGCVGLGAEGCNQGEDGESGCEVGVGTGVGGGGVGSVGGVENGLLGWFGLFVSMGKFRYLV